MSTFGYSKAYSTWGASMGRNEQHDLPADTSARFQLQRVPLDSGGYDPGGAYWGTPSDLYRAQCSVPHDVGWVDMFVRAPSRDAAKQAVLARYPNARFYR